ncbi:MAG: secretin and TonB N-terminal domain-containing protein [Candidatus Omnitrophica bacterium]|nr:secretin and TonB N-terminal domain-containing protein [Candidatus Omnitrophota bacterium]
MKTLMTVVFLTAVVTFCNAQEPAQTESKQAPSEQVQPKPETSEQAVSEQGVLEVGGAEASQNVTLDFKDADIQNVLKIISYKAGINIVTTPDVLANVTIRLVDVPWEKALDVILKTYGFGYERQGNIILVTKMENISKIQSEEPLKTEIFVLKFLDAQDAQKIIIPLLSPRGKVSILYTKGQKGWQFGTFKIGKESSASTQISRESAGGPRSETVSIEKKADGDFVSRKAEFEPSIKSKVLIITDTVASLEKIRNVILPQIDKKPKQVLIETRLIEVNRDKLKDLGFDWGIGSTSNSATETVTTGSIKRGQANLGGHVLGSQVTPSIFSPKSTGINGIEPYDVGAQFVFEKITGYQFSTIIHALEEDVDTNTLSAPKVLTLDNQEASILVGFHTPILASTVTAGSTTTGTGATVTQTLDYYQEIGIRLNVVPQVNEDGYINMIVHPSVTSSSSNITATSVASGVTTETNYPVIDVREAQTQILIKDGETVVIGGLLKDVKSKQVTGIPFLRKIPFIGALFRRESYDTAKVDLLIFITANIVKDGQFSPEEIAKLEKGLDR